MEFVGKQGSSGGAVRKASRLFAVFIAIALLGSSARSDLLPAKRNTSSADTATWPGAGDGIASFRRMKYGFFVHYTWGGSYDGTHNRDGSLPAGLDDLADRFDVSGFANDLASMGVEYVIFTAWHADMNCLWPSVKMNQWLSGHAAQRDLLGEMISAVKAKGIHVLFYTHPRAGHGLSAADQAATGWNGTIGSNPDFTVFDRPKWNNFINDIYSELIDRYGDQIDGLFIDEGVVEADSWRVVDYPRLRQTIKSRQPDLLMVQNFYGTNYSCDIGATEVAYWGSWVPSSDPDNWPATGMPMSMMMGGNWYATLPQGTLATRYNAVEMFRHTVLRAGVSSTDGGGVNWAAGPYPSGGWEDGVLAEMQQIGAWIEPIRRSICNTYPSQSWITQPDSTINGLAAGIVATRSADGGSEFIHVLRPPAGSSLTVPVPADGRGYASASLLESGHAVDLARDSDGGFTLTLQGSDAWNPRDTVIELTPVTVAWVGNDSINGPDTGVWDEAVDNFNSGIPVATRFRDYDNVSFTGAGAPKVFVAPSVEAVGDLWFAGKDYHIYTQGSSVMTLSSGRIDVADGITASFHEYGTAGPLKISGNSGLAKFGGGILVLDLESLYTGNTILTAGVVAFSSRGLGTFGNIVFEGGTLRHLPDNLSDISSRIRHSTSPIRIDTNGNNVTYATPLSPTNTGGLIKLGGGTLFLAGGLHSPGAPIVVADGTLQLEPGSGAIAYISNSGFESPPYEPQGWSYEPTNAVWTFSPDSGIASNDSPWVRVAPEGVQSAFLQNNGSMSTAVNVPLTGDYILSFKASNRPNFPPTSLAVKSDGIPIVFLASGEIGSGADFNRFQSAAVFLAAGLRTLVFEGVQEGLDTDTIIDDVLCVGVAGGALPTTTQLQLAGPTAVFNPGGSPTTLESLAGVSGSRVLLAASNLVITGNDPVAAFAGTITGTGSLTNYGTLRLVGDGSLDFTGSFTNFGVLDIMTWNGTLPAGFVNYGTVLNRTLIRIASLTNSAGGFFLTIDGFKGHSYQLQRSDTLNSDWQNIGNPVPGTSAPIVFSDSGGPPSDRRFYRVSVSP